MTNPRFGVRVAQRDSLVKEIRETKESKERLEDLREALPEEARERIDKNIDKKEDQIVVMKEELKTFSNLRDIPPRGKRD